MRDLKITDRFEQGDNGLRIIDEYGCRVPLCWNNVRDWAAWWLRQADINMVTLPCRVRQVYVEILESEQLKVAQDD